MAEAKTVYGKKGKVKITETGEVDVMDNSANTTYLVQNKPGSSNTFMFEKGSGKDVIVGSDSDDFLSFEDGEVILTKTGKSNDLVIKKNENKDSVTLKDYFTSNDRIDGFSTGEDHYSISDQTIYVSGKGTIEGAIGFDNYIEGSKKADKIYMNGSSNIADGGKGNDTYYITYDNVEMQNQIRINKGDGNDTLTIVEDDDKDYSVYDEYGYSVDKEYYGVPEILFDEDAEFSYSKELTDLIITATHADGKKETVRVTNYFEMEGEINSEQSKAKDGLRVSTVAEDAVETVVKDALEDGEITMTVSGQKVSQLLSWLKKTEGFTLPKGIKIPKALKNITAFVGSEYNDVFEGTNGKDVMVSFAGDNEFTTGNKGQTVIMSMGESDADTTSDDIYNVSSFTAGTVIVDNGGNDKVTVKGVDVNDIHMAGVNGDMLDGTSIAFFTDTKGISNLASINIPKIYKKVMEVMSVVNPDEEHEPTMKQMIKTINSALKMVPGLVDKVRGLGLATIENHYYIGDDYDTPIDATSNLLENITVVDKDGKEQTISKDNIDVYEKIMLNKVMKYMEYATEVLEEKRLMPEGGILEYLVTTPKTKAAKKMYKQLTSGFFNMFKNMYIGTSGDNEYTIKKYEDGVDIVSGTGSDKFIYKGDIGNETGIKYNIVSNFGEYEDETQDVDSIELKNYSFDKNTLYSSEGVSKSGDNVYFDGLSLGAFSAKGTLAAVNYGINDLYDAETYDPADGGFGYDITTEKFSGLTVTDADTTYNVTAEYAADSLAYDWSENASNHYAIMVANNSSVVSNSAYNVISANSFASSNDDNASFTYTYGGGHDFVKSTNDYSYDTYTVEEFSSSTKLGVSDLGMGKGDDTLVIENGDNNVKLFFNVDRTGAADSLFSLISSDNMNKGNFSVYNLGDETQINVNNGVNFSMNLDAYDDDDTTWSSGIEKIMYGETSIDVSTVVDELSSAVASWLQSSSKNYADVADVLNRGSKSEIAEILAIYNDYNVVTDIVEP